MSSIKVVCRFRPLNSKELGLGTSSIVRISDDETSVALQGSESNNFNFDKVYGPETTQESIYKEVAKPIVEDIFKGYNGTVFVYGQTSSGKTHTMMGPDGGKGMNDPTLKGIIPRMVSTIFESVMKADSHVEFLVKVSYIEIYMERIRDLLDPAKTNLQVREEKSKGIWIEDATEIYVTSEEDVLDVMRSGSANRAIAATKMNMESSRSHSIFIVNVFQKNLIDLTNKSGKLYLVDLAGSEKVGKTGAEGQTLNEAKTINKSLSTLGNVINALTDGKSTHVPYRDSKLTRVLQESLGGNSRTTLIVNCSPSSYNEVETISTLRFGTRAKNIKNKPKINQERSVAELKASLARADAEIENLNSKLLLLQEEVRLLKTSGGVAVSAVEAAREKEKEEVIRELEEEKKKLEETYMEVVDQLREKEAEIEAQNGFLESLRNQLSEAKENLDETMKENEVLLEKLALQTVENEKYDYKIEEMRLTIESLTAQLSVVQQQEQEREREERKENLTTPSSPSSRGVSVYSESMQERENSLKESIEKSFTAAQQSSSSSSSSASASQQQRPDAMLSPRAGGGTPSKKRSPTKVHRSSASSPSTSESTTSQSEEISKQSEIVEEVVVEEEEGPIEEDSDELDEMEGKEEQEVKEEEEKEEKEDELERLKTENAKIQEENKKRKAKQKELKKELMQLKKRSEAQVKKLQQEREVEREADKRKYEVQLNQLAEETKKKLGEFDVIKKQLLDDLQDRCLRVVELQIRLDEALEEHQYVLKHSDSKVGIEQHKKNVMLEKVVEKLNATQTKLSNENQSLKSQLEVSSKKVTSQETRIKGLEERLQSMTQRLKDQASYFEEEIKKSRLLMDTLVAMNKQQPPTSSSSASASTIDSSAKGRIIKALRGGGGGGISILGGGSGDATTASSASSTTQPPSPSASETNNAVTSPPTSFPPSSSSSTSSLSTPRSATASMESTSESSSSDRSELSTTSEQGALSPRGTSGEGDLDTTNGGSGSAGETGFWSRFASRPRRISSLGKDCSSSSSPSPSPSPGTIPSLVTPVTTVAAAATTAFPATPTHTPVSTPRE